MPLNEPKRIRGAIFASLDEQRQNHGHLFLTEDALKKSTSRLLNEKQPIPQLCVKPSEIQPVLEDLVLHGELVSSGGNIYPVQTFAQEDETAQKIAGYFGVSVAYLLGQGEQDLLDEADIAFYGQFKELTDEQKETVRDMVRLMRKRNE
jgi:hypothetical protein